MARKIQKPAKTAIDELGRTEASKRTVTLAKASKFLMLVSLLLGLLGLQYLREGDWTLILWAIAGLVVGAILYLNSSEMREDVEHSKRP